VRKSNILPKASRRFGTGREWDWHVPDVCLTHDSKERSSGVWFLLTSLAPPSLYFDLRLTVLTDHEWGEA
jgi:hypothetical protein